MAVSTLEAQVAVDTSSAARARAEARRLAKIEQRVINKALWGVLSGKAVSYADLAHFLPADCDLEAVIRRLSQEDTLEIDRYGKRVVGVLGITLMQTPYRVHMWHPRVYARSFERALGVFADFCESGTVYTPCPVCGKQLALSVKYGGVQEVRPRRHSAHCLFRSMLKLDRRGRLRSDLSASPAGS